MKIPQEIRNKIVAEYTGGKSMPQIKREIGICRDTIANILKENNVSIRFQKIDFDTKTKAFLIKAFQNGKTILQLSKEIGHAKRYVSEVLRNAGLISENHKFRKHSFNENFFDVIDTEEKAYFLGLLFADGCNVRKEKERYELTISLQARDKHILSEFIKAIDYNGKLIFQERDKPHYRDRLAIRLGSKYMSDMLVSKGCVPRKSLVLRYPTKHIPEHLEHHFIRGYFDGDGCVSSYKRKASKKHRKYETSITSTKYFLRSVARIVMKNIDVHCNIRPSIKYGQDITNTLYIKGNKQVMKVFDWMYKDATIFLKRKYKRFLALQEQNNTIHGLG